MLHNIDSTQPSGCTRVQIPIVVHVVECLKSDSNRNRVVSTAWAAAGHQLLTKALTPQHRVISFFSEIWADNYQWSAASLSLIIKKENYKNIKKIWDPTVLILLKYLEHP